MNIFLWATRECNVITVLLRICFIQEPLDAFRECFFEVYIGSQKQVAHMFESIDNVYKLVRDPPPHMLREISWEVPGNSRLASLWHASNFLISLM